MNKGNIPNPVYDLDDSSNESDEPNNLVIINNELSDSLDESDDDVDEDKIDEEAESNRELYQFFLEKEYPNLTYNEVKTLIADFIYETRICPICGDYDTYHNKKRLEFCDTCNKHRLANKVVWSERVNSTCNKYVSKNRSFYLSIALDHLYVRQPKKVDLL